MPRARAAIAGCAVLAALGLAFVAGRGTAVAPPSTDIVITFSYSRGPEKEELLGPLIEKFNRERHKIGDRAISVVAGNEPTSGDQVRIYSPIGPSPPPHGRRRTRRGGEKLNFEEGQREGTVRVSREPQVLMSSATTIAMPLSLAKCRATPTRTSAGTRSSSSPRKGWASVGRPQLGPLKYVHTSPLTSTTGLQATVAAYQFGSHQKDRLTTRRPDPRSPLDAVRTLERSTEHYGDSAVVTTDRLSAKDGSGYASVAALGEVQLLRVNRTRKSSDPLVAIYPSEGMLLREEPFYVLDAEWMAAEETAAAKRAW